MIDFHDPFVLLVYHLRQVQREFSDFPTPENMAALAEIQEHIDASIDAAQERVKAPAMLTRSVIMALDKTTESKLQSIVLRRAFDSRAQAILYLIDEEFERHQVSQ